MSEVDAWRVSAYTIPTETPECDGTADWNETTIVVLQFDSAGKSGLGYAYAHKAAAQVAVDLIKKVILKGDVMDIPFIHCKLDWEARNSGRPGLISSAIAAIDTALWDLKAKIIDKPLLKLLGSTRESVAAYGSGGFTNYSQRKLVDQMTTWAADGLRAVKMKIGRDAAEDLRRVTVVRKELGDNTALYVDANGAYDRKLAVRMAEKFEDLGVTWFEEPVSSDDVNGLRLLVDSTNLQIAAGEYIYTLDDARRLIKGRAIDVLQVDVTRCGGVTNFLKIGHLAEFFHIPLSAHTAPSIHATLCCSSIQAVNVEYFFDHVRIEQMIFDGAVKAVNGFLAPQQTEKGLGLALKERDAEPFLVSDETSI